ncbi:hypothetical protein D3C86_2068240 [compost metagenome]
MKARQRNELHHHLDTTVADPSDKNAFNTLVLKGLHNRNPPSVNPRLVKLIERAQDYRQNGQEKHVKKMNEDYNEYLGNERIHTPSEKTSKD